MTGLSFEERMKKAATVFDNPIPPTPVVEVKKVEEPERPVVKKNEIKKEQTFSPIKNTCPQKHLTYIPKVTRLERGQIEAIGNIVRDISQTRTINSNATRGVKKDRITECSVVRAILNAVMPVLEKKDWDKDPILTESELQKEVRIALFGN